MTFEYSRTGDARLLLGWSRALDEERITFDDYCDREEARDEQDAAQDPVAAA